MANAARRAARGSLFYVVGESVWRRMPLEKQRSASLEQAPRSLRGTRSLQKLTASFVCVALILSSGPVLAQAAPAAKPLTGVVTVQGDSEASAEAGTYKRGDKELKSTDKQVAAEEKHAKEYNGKTEFKANYKIVLKPNGTVDSTKSSVTFTTVNYTSSGRPVPSNFTTLPIPITSVTLNPDGSVKSFEFDSPNWYPPTATGANRLINKGLSGSIDLSNGKTEYKASYQIKSNGVIDTYKVTGTISAPKPAARPAPPAAGRPKPTAEPLTPEEAAEPPALPLLPDAALAAGAFAISAGGVAAAITVVPKQTPPLFIPPVPVSP